MIYIIKKVERAFSDDQFKLQELQTLLRMICNGASNDEPLISIYRVFGLI